jgi:hypothetical protein
LFNTKKSILIKDSHHPNLVRIKLGGVPEHLNYPWLYAIEKGYFEKEGIEIAWVDYPSGTGAMAKDLTNNSLDIAIVLTEGAIKEIANQAPFKIVKTYMESPLIWGIHTSANNPLANVANLNKMKYAVSRMGSGSHLMAYVHAQERGQSIGQEQMIAVNDLQGALLSLKSLDTDLFLWEKFTTKPFVDNGELKRIDEFPTPWPCFVMVATDTWLTSNLSVLDTVIKILHTTVNELLNDIPRLIGSIAQRYKLNAQDVSEWFFTIHWSLQRTVSKEMLRGVHQYLMQLGLANEIEINDLVYDIRLLD